MGEAHKVWNERQGTIELRNAIDAHYRWDRIWSAIVWTLAVTVLPYSLAGLAGVL